MEQVQTDSRRGKSRTKKTYRKGGKRYNIHSLHLINYKLIKMYNWGQTPIVLFCLEAVSQACKN